MSVLSNAVFNTNKALQSQPNPPKRSQIFELYASCLGFKTFAACKAASSHETFDKLKSVAPETIRARLQQRLTELSIPSAFLEPLAKSIWRELQELQTSAPQLVLGDAARYLGLLDGDVNLSPSQIKSLKQQLKAMAEAGDANARLLYVLWQFSELSVEAEFDEDIEELDEDDGSEYWYKQRLAGATLSTTATEWADAYERSLKDKQSLEQFISAFPLSSLAIPNIQDILHDSNDPNFSCSLSAHAVITSLEQYYPPSPEYLMLMSWYQLSNIQNPAYGSLQTLFNESGNLVEQYAIYLFALDCGVDISQGHYWLVNSNTGEEWDEHGPAEPQGVDGVDLPTLNAADSQSAVAMKDRLIALHRQSGKAR
jgi:hypothetical protein